MWPQSGSGVAGVFINHPHSLPVAERELFVQSILSGDAGLIGLEDAAIAVCPSPLIEVHIPEAAKDGLAWWPSKAQAMHLKSLSEEAYQSAA
jgi:hypothetical protein